jgi:hypothetical protein
MKVRIPASELQVGDIVDKGNYAYRVEYIETTDKMVNTSSHYIRCDFEPERVGSPWSMNIRKSTVLNVEREDVA